LPVSDFERITSALHEQGYSLLSEVDHPIDAWLFLIPIKPWALLPKLWALPNRDGRLLNRWKKLDSAPVITYPGQLSQVFLGYTQFFSAMLQDYKTKMR